MLGWPVYCPSSIPSSGPSLFPRLRRSLLVKVYSGENIRNVAMVGHGHAGKTSLLSAMLYTAGATPRLGRVDDGSATTDYDEEEIARKMSIAAAAAYVEWGKTKINVIDTPGFNMFVHEARDGAAGGGCGDCGGGWRGRRGSGDAAGVERLRRIQDAAADCGEPHGPRPGECGARAGVADQCVWAECDSDRAADWQREEFDAAWSTWCA